jgi:hypothetical protein
MLRLRRMAKLASRGTFQEASIRLGLRILPKKREIGLIIALRNFGLNSKETVGIIKTLSPSRIIS